MLLGMLKLHPDNTDISDFYVVSENFYVLSMVCVCLLHVCVYMCGYMHICTCAHKQVMWRSKVSFKCHSSGLWLLINCHDLYWAGTF